MYGPPSVNVNKNLLWVKPNLIRNNPEYEKYIHKKNDLVPYDYMDVYSNGKIQQKIIPPAYGPDDPRMKRFTGNSGAEMVAHQKAHPLLKSIATQVLTGSGFFVNGLTESSLKLVNAQAKQQYLSGNVDPRYQGYSVWKNITVNDVLMYLTLFNEPADYVGRLTKTQISKIRKNREMVRKKQPPEFYHTDGPSGVADVIQAPPFFFGESVGLYNAYRGNKLLNPMFQCSYPTQPLSPLRPLSSPHLLSPVQPLSTSQAGLFSDATNLTIFDEIMPQVLTLHDLEVAFVAFSQGLQSNTKKDMQILNRIIDRLYPPTLWNYSRSVAKKAVTLAQKKALISNAGFMWYNKKKSLFNKGKAGSPVEHEAPTHVARPSESISSDEPMESVNIGGLYGGHHKRKRPVGGVSFLGGPFKKKRFF